MTTPPPPQPAPTPTPQNIMSLIRLVLGLAAGALGYSAWATGARGQAVMALITIALTVLWIIYKNNRYVQALITALQSVPVQLYRRGEIVPKGPGAMIIPFALVAGAATMAAILRA